MTGVNGSLKPSNCETVKRCDKCGYHYNKTHKCVTGKCAHCGVALVPDVKHQCFIQGTKAQAPNDKLVFYDFETRYEEGKHRPNFASSITFDEKEFHAEGPGCVGRLMRKYRTSQYAGYTFMAHNAAGFDHYLIAEYLVDMGITPSIVMSGGRIIYMCDPVFNQRYIDSYSFIPMALAKTPAAFDLKTQDKGYFPHKFNIEANRHYKGDYPSKDFYDYDRMSDAQKERFDSWYESVRHTVFDFQNELSKYGINDVVLLREACLVYRKEFIQSTGVDPFNQTTLASCCMAVYKSQFLAKMPKDLLAHTYDGCYVNQHKSFSNASIQWLSYIGKTRGVSVEHALNEGERRFGPYFVDGFYQEPSGQGVALEFCGCFYHGHECTYDPNNTSPLTGETYGLLRERVRDKVQNLELGHGLRVEVVWECEWNKAMKEDPQVRDFMATYKRPERLKPREGLYGGRTNGYKLYHHVSDGEYIEYLDFTSLYPFCMARKSYPVGHPEVIYKDFQPLENYYGFIKARLLPPRGLLHPVLPHRCREKLMFPLCGTCAETDDQTGQRCEHSDAERAITGTWPTIEFMKGLEHGYIVDEVFEVWHFPERSDDLFSGYVRTFLQMKQEASGYPAHVVTEAEKQAYVDDYFAHEGIKLDRANIAANPAKRAIAKLLLNSLWGRFSMRENLPTTMLISDPEEFSRYIFHKDLEITHFSFLSDTMALLQYIHPKQTLSKSKDINVFLGAFTTAHARLELYDLMSRLGDRLLYSDTDSVVFVTRPGDWRPPQGCFLGDLTNEVDEDDHIVEFACGGPKTYGYRTQKGKVVMKAKGITLTPQNAKVVKLDTLIDLVDNYVVDRDTGKHVLAQMHNIARDKRTLTLRNTVVEKRFRVVYNKRVLLSDYNTLPYGY